VLAAVLARHRNGDRTRSDGGAQPFWLSSKTIISLGGTFIRSAAFR